MAEEFLISRGGPFYELQRQVGLVSESADRVVTRTLVFVGLTAFAPLLIELLSRDLSSTIAIMLSPDFVARYAIFIVIAVMMERTLEKRLKEFLARFSQSGVLGPQQKEQGAALVAKALRLRNSTAAEIVCLAIAVAMTVLPLSSASLDSQTMGLLLTSDADPSLTPAGWWIAVVSNPLFWFLVLRWLWRITLWSLLLHWLSRLDLRLVATHPDKSGGIAFVGKYPNAFSPFVFAFSSVIAAIVFRQIEGEGMTVETFGFLMSAWLAIVLVAFLAPLTSFVVPLARLREATLQAADAIDTRTQRESERKTLGRNMVGPEENGQADEEAASGDPAAFRKAAGALRLRPFSREAAVPLAMSALVPLLIAGSSVLPLKELLKIAKKLLLF